MFVSEVNDVKIYNLSAGKSLPEVNTLILNADSVLIALFLTFSGYLKLKSENL
jgi:hypothetical protein